MKRDISDIVATKTGLIFVNNQLTNNSFSCMYISILYMFRTAMCPSSGELYQYDIWYMSLCMDDRLVCRFGWDSSRLIQTYTPNGHLYRV